MDIKYEWDENKRRANYDKHQLDFEVVRSLNWNEATSIIRSDRYGEERFTAFIYIESRLHVVVFTLREDTFRVISFRVASSREVRRYG